MSGRTGEQVGAGLPQLDRLLVEFAGAAVGVGSYPQPHGFDAVLVVGIEEDHDGVPLRVVEGVHRFGRHVQEGVLVLRTGETASAAQLVLAPSGSNFYSSFWKILDFYLVHVLFLKCTMFREREGQSVSSRRQTLEIVSRAKTAKKTPRMFGYFYRGFSL